MSRVLPTGSQSRAAAWRPLGPTASRRSAAPLAALALAGLLGACAPRAPLYAPLAAGVDHGYTDRAITLTQYHVAYDAPPLRSVAVTKAARDQEVQRRVSLAYDMALWRAAELASGNGYPAFTIADRTNTVALVRHDYYDQAERPICYTRYAVSVIDCAPFTAPDYLTGYVVIDADVAFTVAFEKSVGPGSIDAGQTIAKMKARYPDAAMVDQDVE